MDKPNVIVVQMGARRGYELARMLHEMDQLAMVYTDLAWCAGESSIAAKLLRIMMSNSDPRIARRTIQGIPPNKVRSSVIPNLAGYVCKLLGVSVERRYRIEDWLLGCMVRIGGAGDANVVVNTAGNGGLSMLDWARKRQLSVVTDVVITPRALAIEAEEQAKWPGWEATAQGQKEDIAINRAFIEGVVARSDLLLCPSETVYSGLMSVATFKTEKARIIPYGCGYVKRVHSTRPTEKRVLFAGTAGLRKGIAYLAAASQILASLDPDVQVFVAGTVNAKIRNRPECRHLRFLGHLGQSELSSEMACADVFCLPTLAEGMASVVLEALLHGLPCIVTKEAGTPVEDGLQGIVIKSRDPEAIAEAIIAITSDRVLRNRMSVQASELSMRFHPDEIRTQLDNALTALLQR